MRVLYTEQQPTAKKRNNYLFIKYFCDVKNEEHISCLSLALTFLCEKND